MKGYANYLSRDSYVNSGEIVVTKIFPYIQAFRKYIMYGGFKLIKHTRTVRLKWACVLSWNLNLLQRTQNTGARIITHSRKSTHITPVLQFLHWLPVRYRIDYKIILLTYKALNNLAPNYICDLIQTYSPGRTLRSANKSLLYTTKFKRSSYGGRAFSHAAPKLWNSLPLEFRQASSLSIFKKRLKTNLLERVYSVCH